MATFVDERSDEPVQLNEGEELATFEPQGQIEATQEVEQEIQQPQEEIPDKYRNKDIKEIIRMHQEAEKLLGKHSQEVGELRRTVDDFIKTQLQEKQQNKDSPTRLDISDDDFFVSPTEAVQKSIESHPAIQEARFAAANLKKQEALATLKNRHPDYEAVVADRGFAEWVQSSNIRKQLLIRADQQFDVEAADELFTLWKEKQQAVKATVEANRQANKNAVKQASVGTFSASAEPKSRKIYRRQDIVNLMMKDPVRYEALQDEIMRAYSEGRVR